MSIAVRAWRRSCKVLTTTGALALQVIGLGTLELTVALGFWGWVAGVAHLVVLTTLLMHGAHRAQLPGLGMANAVTLVRALLGGQVLALTIALLVGDSEALAVMIGIAVVAIALDGVDGQVARRTHNCSDFGARFDLEADAFLVMVLSVYAAVTLGWWVLAIGLMRYGFVLAAQLAPWLNRSLPVRMDRKVVAVMQMLGLVVASSGVLPTPYAQGLLAVSLTALCWSFGRDVLWLWQRRDAPRQAEMDS
ncbi:CDP-alcohol phosphatidyltransferase family protein [Propionibacteriaceae bacterium Y1685]